MEQTFKIDLTEIEGEGEFLCPTCGKIISPDDESGMVYDILEIETDEDGLLQRVIIQCKKCRSIIYLEGFRLLKKIGYSEEYFGLNNHLDFRADLESVHQLPFLENK